MKLVGDVTISGTRVEEIKQAITAGTMSKGAGIRECFAGGLEVKAIAEGLDIRYNHVYNVCKNEVLVHGLETEASDRTGENSKKGQIIKMLKEGKNITQISAEMKCMYNYVWQIAKAEGYTKKQMEEAAAEVPKKGKKKETVTA